MKTIYRAIISLCAIISFSSCDKNVTINTDPHAFEVLIKAVDANGVCILSPDIPWYEELSESKIAEVTSICGESTVDYTSISEITRYSNNGENMLLRLAAMSSDFESMPREITCKFYSVEIFGNDAIHTIVTTWSYPTDAPYNSPVLKVLESVTIDGVNYEIIVDNGYSYVKMVVV